MSFQQNNDTYFNGQQGAEDGSTPGGASGNGPQGQIPQQMDPQAQFNNMQVGASGNGGDSPDNKTTLW